MTSAVPPICVSCLFLDGWKTCAAFPKGIPESIWTGGGTHQTPIDGDSGIVYMHTPGAPEPTELVYPKLAQ
jgi:hypothetical protein